MIQRERDIHRIQPDMKETLELWRLPATADTMEERLLNADIKCNVQKTTKSVYHTAGESRETVIIKLIPDDINAVHTFNATKDLSSFAGVHQDTTTILYVPPRRGWSGSEE
jgi:hypothetical protein